MRVKTLSPVMVHPVAAATRPITRPRRTFYSALAARAFDESTGLQNNLNRWLDATTGKWLSEDPIGFNAGDTNLARYVGNHPTGATDPSGLEYVMVDENGTVWAVPESWWFGRDYDKIYVGRLIRYTYGGQSVDLILLPQKRRDVFGKERNVILHYAHFARFVDSFEFTNFTHEHLNKYACDEGYGPSDSKDRIGKVNGDVDKKSQSSVEADRANEKQQLQRYVGSYNWWVVYGEAGDAVLEEIVLNGAGAGLGAIAKSLVYVKFAKKAHEVAEASLRIVSKIGHTTTWGKMSKAQQKAFQHSYSRHCAELGLKNWKQKNAEALRIQFNKVVGHIRSKGKKLPAGTRKPYNGKSVEVNYYEAIFHGTKYYYYETLDGIFISAGKAR